jgi:xanthine dehydrogenase accessory factor
LRDVLDAILGWLTAGRRVAAATVVEVIRSAPRPPGATMAVNDRGEVAGSVSGGCVEGALYEEAAAVLETGVPRLVTYGISDEQAFSVGLSCGGTIHVFVERLDPAAGLLAALAEAIRQDEPVALATVIAGPAAGAKLLVDEATVRGFAGPPCPADALAAEARAMLRRGETGTRRLGGGGTGQAEAVEAFVQSFAAPPRLHVFGAVEQASALARVARILGYRVTVCDARPVFATPERFPDADRVVAAWPQDYLAGARVGPRDAICVLSHDPKFDVPALLAALDTPAFYIGAMGSRATRQRRERELLAAGATPEQLRRIASPVGLDLGGRTPEEIAVAIAAEMIAVRHGRSGGRLWDGGREPAPSPADAAGTGGGGRGGGDTLPGTSSLRGSHRV